VVKVRDLRGHLHQRRGERREHLDRVGDVLLRGGPFVADEPAGLEQHAIGHEEFAEVVDARRLRQLGTLDLRKAHAPADRLGVERHPATMIAGPRIADVDGLHQRVEGRPLDGEDGLGQCLLVGVDGTRLRHRVQP